MFYSHEILTSREHGVATVWLVATLGSKSSASKVNRKAILDVDVPKACGMIIHPEAPMALRLQGNLLYGVSKVYSQQCGYALVDAQGVKDRMWTMHKTMRSGGLDPDAGKARPEQLVLPHDPTFIPELMLPGLNVELSSLEISEGPQTPRKSSLLSSSHLQLSNKSAPLPGGQLGLNLSSSDVGAGSGGRFGFASDMGSSTRKEPEIELPPFVGGEEAGILLHPDFEIDEEGNIVELPVKRPRLGMPLADRMRSEQRKETEVRDPGMEVDNPNQFEAQNPLGDDIEMMDAEDEFRPANDNFEFDGTYANNEESEVPVVQMRQKRKTTKAMDIDDPPELRNADLAQWNSQYLQNMAVASKFKENNKLVTVAKKNAAFWVLGIGVASVGVGIGASRTPHPLEVFSGEQLLAALTGNPLGASRQKRSRGGADDEGRNVRQKVGGQEYLRGDGLDDDDGPGFIYDDIEIGREAPSSLHDDHSSQMPWNITASVQSSRHGSALGTRRAGPGHTGRPQSVNRSGADGAANTAGAAADARRGRLTSASPLAHRGVMRSPMDLGGRLDLPSDHELDLDSLNGVYNLGDNDGENVQTGNNQWDTGSLDQESVNFFSFVKERIGGKEDDKGNIKFSSLLPPQSNSRVVATEAFLHVLTLATSGALLVRQKMAMDARGSEDVGGIHITLAG